MSNRYLSLNFAQTFVLRVKTFFYIKVEDIGFMQNSLISLYF